jgi:hypothetical protein
VDRAFRKLGKEVGQDRQAVLEIWSVFAFEMMLDKDHRRDFSVSENKIGAFTNKAKARFVGGSNGSAATWDRLNKVDVLTNTVLTDRCILEGNDQQTLCFRSL